MANGVAPRLLLFLLGLSTGAFVCVLTICRNLFLDRHRFGRRLGGTFIGLMCIGSRRFRVRLLPNSLGDLERVDMEILPPGYLIADF